jgi:class 3 adenylate cyclase/tetratricopeptide (TPR) repeat protein
MPASPGSKAEMVTCPSCGTDNPEGARFCYSCGAAIGISLEPARETRKTVTVLFIDAVSSTSLGERLDPESMRAVMTRYFDAMRDAIESHGGAVEKFIGDAVMAIFGVPTVHEDDALRACRAAVEIRRRLAELEPQIRADRGVAIEWRAGINTGQVVAGDVAAGQRIVTGDAVNVAARLEAAAAPGEILIGSETQALVRDAVTAEPVEALTLKGKAEPVPAWRLLAVGEIAGRHARPQEAPLIGRRRPLRLLEEAFNEAVEDRVCHLFTVLGVAGVGKSRLVDEFLAGLGDRARVASGRCLPYGSGITYWPVAEALRSGIGIAEAATTDEAAAALGTALSDEPEAERIAGAVGSLIGLDSEPHDQEELFWAVRKTFEALARRRPLVLVLDDIHWGEATFLDLVEHIADWTRDAPILLIAMARSELLEKRPAWGGGKRSAITVQLEPLSDVESDQLVASLLGDADLPPDFRGRVSQAAEGNPLFVEELLAKLIDDGFLQRTAAGWASAGDLRDLSIPPSIQALLAARLDGLSADERAVIERGAVEGKTFHRGAVTALASEPLRPNVPDRLAGLLRMELVRPDQAAFAGEEAYRFRHLLIRDAAYQGLAKQTRSELHERFADWLERVAADREIEYGEIIAYHLEQAYRYRTELGPPDAAALELARRSGTLLAQACRRAQGRGDIGATLDLLQRAVSLLPPGDVRRLLVAQTGIHVLYAGDGAMAERMLAETIAEAQVAGDDRAAAWANISLLMVRGSTKAIERSEMVRQAEQLRDQLTRVGDLEGAQAAELLAGQSLFQMGRAEDAFIRTQRVFDNPASGTVATWAWLQRTGAAVFGPMPADEVVALMERSIAENDRHPGPRTAIARMRILQGRFAEATEVIDGASQRGAELGDRIFETVVGEVVGSIAFRLGDIEQAAQRLRRSYDALVALGDRGFASTTATLVAEAYVETGDLAQAWDFATIARETSASDDVASQSGGRQIQAEVLSARGQHQEAEALAREAVAIMEATDYLAFRGGALVHLARVLQAAGKGADAVEAARRAIDLYEAKGATFFADSTRKLIADWSAQPA